MLSALIDLCPRNSIDNKLTRFAAIAPPDHLDPFSRFQILLMFEKVLNLFDRTYEETFGFPALGRSALVGLRVAAGR